MKELQPKIEPIQQKMKAAATQQLKNEAYQELQQLYQQHQLNPLTTMFGCLPMLIQIPILLGLYATLKWPTSGGILSHPTFMWFHLTSPDSMMAMIAGFMYFVQSWLSARQMPKEQKNDGLCDDDCFPVIYSLHCVSISLSTSFILVCKCCVINVASNYITTPNASY